MLEFSCEPISSKVSETGVWGLSEKTNGFSQTLRQTPFRHLLKNPHKTKMLCVSDVVSDTVCHPSNCHCLSGGVSLGRASPDTRQTEYENG